jgi:hypothetical protein
MRFFPVFFERGQKNYYGARSIICNRMIRKMMDDDEDEDDEKDEDEDENDEEDKVDDDEEEDV